MKMKTQREGRQCFGAGSRQAVGGRTLGSSGFAARNTMTDLVLTEWTFESLIEWVNI